MKEKANPWQFNRNPQEQELNESRKQGLLTSLLAAASRGFYIDSLETGVDKSQLLKLLSSYSWLKNEASITEMLYFLRTEGDRTAYTILLPHLLATTNKEALEETIRQRFFGVEQFIRFAHNLHPFLTLAKKDNTLLFEKEDLERGILAWDMSRLINLARIAYETENITQEEAWSHIEYAEEQCRKTFKNWKETGKSYLLGKAMKSSQTEDWDQAIAYFLLVTESEEGPWKE